MKKSYAKRVLDIDASGVRKMFEMGKGMRDPVDLTVGQADFPIPDGIKQAAIEAIEENKNKYTMTLGLEELREAVARNLWERKRIKAEKENVMITDAVSGGLTLAYMSLLDDGDEIIVADPYFVAYKHLATLSGAKPVFVDTYPDFILKPESIEGKITDKTKAILISSPGNPTGRVYSEKEIRDIVEVARKYDLYIVSDEIYADFVYDGTNMSPGSIYEKTITLDGFSKSHAMMGWRVGYLVAPAEVIEQMLKIQQYVFVCAPTPFQYAALVALETSTEKEAERYKANRDLIMSELSGLYEMQNPDGAFYAFIKYPYDPELFISKCLERELLIVPGNVFSEKNTHFRLCFAVSEDVLRRGLAILKEVAK